MFNDIPYNTLVKRVCGFRNQSAVNISGVWPYLPLPFITWLFLTSFCLPFQINYLSCTFLLVLGGSPEWKIPVDSHALYFQWVQSVGNPVGDQRESSQATHPLPPSHWDHFPWAGWAPGSSCCATCPSGFCNLSFSLWLRVVTALLL